MLRGSTYYCAIAPRTLSRHIADFLGSRRMETAPTSIEVLLCPTLDQSDEPFDLRGSLSPTTRHRCTHVLIYTAPDRPRQSPLQLWTRPGVASLQWSSRHRLSNAVFRMVQHRVVIFFKYHLRTWYRYYLLMIGRNRNKLLYRGQPGWTTAN